MPERKDQFIGIYSPDDISPEDRAALRDLNMLNDADKVLEINPSRRRQRQHILDDFFPLLSRVLHRLRTR